MGTSSIPVDLVNPGHVFACMGLLEAAHELCGPAEAGFVWDDPHAPMARFEISADGATQPVRSILQFIAGSEVHALAPSGWEPAKPDAKGNDAVRRVKHAPALELGDMALPIRLVGSSGVTVDLGHWADGSSRDAFKLYSGNRSALGIARAMIGTKSKGSGIAQLFEDQPEELASDPLGTAIPMHGSFNFDARCAWASIDTGYSPDKQGQKVFGSPVVELLSAWGLQNARPRSIEGRTYRYAAWRHPLPPMLARAALPGQIRMVDSRRFSMTLALSGKNKVVRYAEEDTSR